MRISFGHTSDCLLSACNQSVSVCCLVFAVVAVRVVCACATFGSPLVCVSEQEIRNRHCVAVFQRPGVRQAQEAASERKILEQLEPVTSQRPYQKKRRATAKSARVENKCECSSPLSIVDSTCPWPVKIEHYNGLIGTLADPAHLEQVLSMLDEDPANKCLVNRLRIAFKPRRAMVAYATAKLGRTVNEHWHCPEAQKARLLVSKSPDVPVWDAACPIMHPGLCRCRSRCSSRSALNGNE